MYNTIPVVIPAYEPDNRLILLLDMLDENKVGPIIIVDDGSGAQYNKIFNQAKEIIERSNGTLLVHSVNQGKGRALKTAFHYILQNLSENITGVITADSDGQHTVICIKKIMEALDRNPDNLILGVRNFSGKGIPWKSRFGNNLTEKVFSYVAGIHVSDTQTGLRGIPRAFLQDLLNVPGERFEFETQMLLESTGKFPIMEVPIETIYDSEENHQTHFNPVTDSIKIYRILGKKFIKYIVSSFSASIIDLLLFLVFCYIFKEKFIAYIAISTVLARIVSATYNCLINYKMVFKSNENIAKSSIKYFILAVIQMGLSAVLVTGGVNILRFIPEFLVKIVVDTLLFFVSYHIQQKYVFRRRSCGN